MAGKEKHIDRRVFLQTAGRAVAGAALAVGGLDLVAGSVAYGRSKSSDDEFDKYDFLLPRVKFFCRHLDPKDEDKWNLCPGGDRNLLQEFSSTVRCRVKLPRNCRDAKPRFGTEDQFNAVVDFDHMEQLRKYPFLLMTEEKPYTFTRRQKTNLKQYLEEGGFLFMDECVYKPHRDLFWQSSYKLLEEVFAPGAVKRIPNDHEVFHNVFDLSSIGLPHILGINHGARGLFIGDRLAVFLSSTDLHCGWGDRRRKRLYAKSIQMSINIIMYAILH